MYMGTFAHANLPIAASAMVTAGLMCAPLKLPTAYTATVTANAQPAVMTIQPLFWPLVRLSTTLATTPSPRMINSMVPSSSARKGDMGVTGMRRSYRGRRTLSIRKRSPAATPRRGFEQRASRASGALGEVSRTGRRDRRTRLLGDLPLFAQRGDERFRLFGVERKRSRLLYHLIHQRLLAVQGRECGLDVAEDPLDPPQPLLGLLDLPLAVVQPVGGVMHVADQTEHVLEHRAGLRDFFLGGRDRPHVVHGALGDLEQTVHVGLQGVERRLTLGHLFEPAIEMRLDRFPLGEPL